MLETWVFPSCPCQGNPQRDVVNRWSNVLDRGTITVDQISRMAVAARDRHRSMIRLLVENGANVNSRAELGWTPLILAARGGDLENVKYLLSKGADPNIKDEDGKSIIELAEQAKSTNRFEVIQILRSARAAH